MQLDVAAQSCAGCCVMGVMDVVGCSGDVDGRC